MGARILVVEDNRGMREALAQGLSEERYEALVAATGGDALVEIAKGGCDGVLLDLGLPDLDGTAVIREIRRSACEIPILVLSARDDLASRVEALDAGADDFIVKPFAFDEVLARVRSLLRRARAAPWSPLAAGNLRLIPSASLVEVSGVEVALSPRERDILTLLLRRSGHSVTRSEILSEVFGYDFDPGTNAIDVHISHLRKKLGRSGVLIETVRGVGYRLIEDSPP